MVCSDFLYNDINFLHLFIFGSKFHCLQPAFVKTCLSSNYGIYLGSNLSEVTERWPVKNEAAKIQAFPRRPHGNNPILVRKFKSGRGERGQPGHVPGWTSSITDGGDEGKKIV
jgi:hypothetical protein